MSDHSVHIWSSMTGHQAACSCKWTGEEYATKAEAEAQRDRHIAGERIMAEHLAKPAELEAPHRDTPMQPLMFVPPVAHALTRLELEVVLIALELYSDRKLTADKRALAAKAMAKIAAMITVLS